MSVRVAPGGGWRGALRAELSARSPVRLHNAPPQASAAVLVPIVEREGELFVWLVERAAHLRKHAGEVAFPGGKRDEVDADLVAMALREASEEVGLDDAEILGALDDVLTLTGFGVTPVVAAVEADWVPRPNADEVAAVFVAPLGRFLGRPAWSARFGFGVGDHWVWGATAKMACACAAIAAKALPAQR